MTPEEKGFCDACSKHSAMEEFKTNLIKDKDELFEKIDSLEKSVAPIWTTIKIGGGLFSLFMVILIVISTTSYLNLSNFILETSKMRVEDKVAFENLSNSDRTLTNSVKDNVEEIDDLNEEVNEIDHRLQKVEK